MAPAEELWDRFAGAIAGRSSVRVSYDGGTTYAYPRRIGRRPPQPAAVALYGRDMMTRCLALDFDVGAYGIAQAAADAKAFAAAIRSCGGRVVEDWSPTGGRHVYVPLQTPRSLEIVRRVMAGLSARYPSLDVTPMVNAATGCIRPPGAAHPRGGSQELITPVDEAVDTFRVRNSDGVWAAFLSSLGALDYRPKSAKGAQLLVTAPHAHRHGGRVPLPAFYEAIARTGRYDRRRYKSGSEARQAVLTSAYRKGWTLQEVAAELRLGAWRGLGRLYAKYARRGRLIEALAYDWETARGFVTGGSRADKSDTRGSSHAPPTVETSALQHARRWWTAMRAWERRHLDDRAGQSDRQVLRSLVATSIRTRSRYVKAGVRSVALGTCLERTAAAESLRRLRDWEDSPLVLIEAERGHGNADIYELRIPDAHAQLAEDKRWRPGRLDAIHPAFLELGVPAAFVYEALSEAREPIRTVKAVAVAAMLERDATSAALRQLEALGLVESTAEGWTRGPADLAAVADLLGAVRRHEERVDRYRRERATYRKTIDDLAVTHQARRASREPPIGDVDVIDLREPDADPHYELDAAADLVMRELRAVRLVPG